MNRWNEWWSELSLYRKVLLIILAVQVVAFGVATGVFASRPGLAYGDTLLLIREEDGVLRYQGRIDGEDAAFAVFPDGVVEYRWGDYQYGPYQVVEDPSAEPEGWDSLTGIEIRQGDEVLFRGGYRSGSAITLFQEDGTPLLDIGISTTSGGGTVLDGNGREISTEELHEPGLSALARLVLAPELTHRGSWGLWLLITLLALFNGVQICFPGFFFRLSLLGHVRNIEDVEPSEFYIAMQRLGWAALTLLCLVLYHMCLNRIWT